MQQGRQLLVGGDHVADRLVAVVRDFLGRRQDDVLTRSAPVQNQRGQHDASRDARLPVLLADQQQELADQSAPGVAVIRAKDGTHEVSRPRAHGVRHPRTAGRIHHAQLAEHGHCFLGLVREQRRQRDQRPPVNDALFPVGTSGRPVRHALRLAAPAGRRAAWPLRPCMPRWPCRCTRTGPGASSCRP